MISLPHLPVLPFAHALVARQDLPIPAWLFAWAASIVLIVSFFALSVGWREPRFEEEDWRPILPRLSRVLLSMPVQVLCGLAAVFLLWLTVYSGLRGTEAPDRNFALSFVFVTFWLGFPVASVLIGDVFRAFNPWRAVGRAIGARSGPSAARSRCTPATPSGSAAGRRRSACSPSSGSRSSTARAAASPSASTRMRPASPPSSTPPTRWR